jgi:energy-coupling factor transporter transmembrane protein EcfT
MFAYAKKKSVTVEKKRHDTIGDGVNIVFCPQTYVPKCSLSLVKVCATSSVCLARCLRKGRLYLIFVAKTDSLSFNTQWFFIIIIIILLLLLLLFCGAELPRRMYCSLPRLIVLTPL